MTGVSVALPFILGAATNIIDQRSRDGKYNLDVKTVPNLRLGSMEIAGPPKDTRKKKAKMKALKGALEELNAAAENFQSKRTTAPMKSLKKTPFRLFSPVQNPALTDKPDQALSPDLPLKDKPDQALSPDLPLTYNPVLAHYPDLMSQPAKPDTICSTPLTYASAPSDIQQRLVINFRNSLDKIFVINKYLSDNIPTATTISKQLKELKKYYSFTTDNKIDKVNEAGKTSLPAARILGSIYDTIMKIQEFKFAVLLDCIEGAVKSEETNSAIYTIVNQSPDEKLLEKLVKKIFGLDDSDSSSSSSTILSEWSPTADDPSVLQMQPLKGPSTEHCGDSILTFQQGDDIEKAKQIRDRLLDNVRNFEGKIYVINTYLKEFENERILTIKPLQKYDILKDNGKYLEIDESKQLPDKAIPKIEQIYKEVKIFAKFFVLLHCVEGAKQDDVLIREIAYINNDDKKLLGRVRQLFDVIAPCEIVLSYDSDPTSIKDRLTTNSNNLEDKIFVINKYLDCLPTKEKIMYIKKLRPYCNLSSDRIETINKENKELKKIYDTAVNKLKYDVLLECIEGAEKDEKVIRDIIDTDNPDGLEEQIARLFITEATMSTISNEHKKGMEANEKVNQLYEEVKTFQEEMPQMTKETTEDQTRRLNEVYGDTQMNSKLALEQTEIVKDAFAKINEITYYLDANKQLLLQKMAQDSEKWKNEAVENTNKIKKIAEEINAHILKYVYKSDESIESPCTNMFTYASSPSDIQEQLITNAENLKNEIFVINKYLESYDNPTNDIKKSLERLKAYYNFTTDNKIGEITEAGKANKKASSLTSLYNEALKAVKFDVLLECIEGVFAEKDENLINEIINNPDAKLVGKLFFGDSEAPLLQKIQELLEDCKQANENAAKYNANLEATSTQIKADIEKEINVINLSKEAAKKGKQVPGVQHDASEILLKNKIQKDYKRDYEGKIEEINASLDNVSTLEETLEKLKANNVEEDEKDIIQIQIQILVTESGAALKEARQSMQASEKIAVEQIQYFNDHIKKIDDSIVPLETMMEIHKQYGEIIDAKNKVLQIAKDVQTIVDEKEYLFTLPLTTALSALETANGEIRALLDDANIEAQKSETASIGIRTISNAVKKDGKKETVAQYTVNAAEFTKEVREKVDEINQIAQTFSDKIQQKNESFDEFDVEIKQEFKEMQMEEAKQLKNKLKINTSRLTKDEYPENVPDDILYEGIPKTVKKNSKNNAILYQISELNDDDDDQLLELFNAIERKKQRHNPSNNIIQMATNVFKRPQNVKDFTIKKYMELYTNETDIEVKHTLRQDLNDRQTFLDSFGYAVNEQDSDIKKAIKAIITTSDDDLRDIAKQIKEKMIELDLNLSQKAKDKAAEIYNNSNSAYTKITKLNEEIRIGPLLPDPSSKDIQRYIETLNESAKKQTEIQTEIQTLDNNATTIDKQATVAADSVKLIRELVGDKLSYRIGEAETLEREASDYANKVKYLVAKASKILQNSDTADTINEKIKQATKVLENTQKQLEPIKEEIDKETLEKITFIINKFVEYYDKADEIMQSDMLDALNNKQKRFVDVGNNTKRAVIQKIEERVLKIFADRYNEEQILKNDLGQLAKEYDLRSLADVFNAYSGHIIEEIKKQIQSKKTEKPKQPRQSLIDFVKGVIKSDKSKNGSTKFTIGDKFTEGSKGGGEERNELACAIVLGVLAVARATAFVGRDFRNSAGRGNRKEVIESLLCDLIISLVVIGGLAVFDERGATRAAFAILISWPVLCVVVFSIMAFGRAFLVKEKTVGAACLCAVLVVVAVTFAASVVDLGY